MSSLTRRAAIGFGVLSGSALLSRLGRAEAADEERVIFAGEKAVLFKLKDVTIERVDRAGRTIDVSSGKKDKPLKMADLPLGEDIRIRVSYVRPGVANNLPFEWDRLEELVGKQVSMMLRAESSRLSIESIATEND
jgi:hypothetical protein